MRTTLILGAILCFGGVASASTCGAATGTVLNLTGAGSSGFINLGFFQQIPDQSTGTGVIDSFVRLQTNDSCEDGFNTDLRPTGNTDINTSPTFTHDLLTADVPIVNIGGTNYLQFLLDINQTGANPLLSLEQIKIYQNNVDNASLAQLVAGDLRYSLDGAGDRYISLDASLNSGSGSGDMFAYIPQSLFTGGNHIYLYSEFGEHLNTNDGFEEWATIKGATAVPEPVSSGLIGTGLVALFFVRRRMTAKA